MKLLKPSWVTHDGHPIFSVDIHPDGSRFATGGQGVDTGRIVIWNMAPVVDENEEKDENVPKMLCQMDNHLACVNCVRWSANGKYLASGGDDKVLMIWQTGRYGSGSTALGTGGKVVNVEHWRCISTLRGHSGDVLDLAWSPHDAWLASCSVDNTIVIWNTQKWQEIIAVLKGHTGLVKGVSWDPVGKYVASQSDDKSLRVWRTHDWQEESLITEPFLECGGTTHILRLSWSPDGQYLVSAHAMNNSGPTAQIIERDGWKTNKDFVGHRKAITCVRFNPNILYKVNKETDKVQHFCCCAIGSRDRSLSVWLTYLKRPLVVVHDLFSNSVLDISWSQTGNQLIVCSWDGTVAYIDFSEDEIGKPVSVDEKSLLHQRLYGKSMAMTNHTASTAVIENPEMLKVQEEHQKKEELEKEENILVNCNSVAHNDISVPKQEQMQLQSPASKPLLQIKGPTDKQIETRMPDGRRRITPLFIPPAPDIGDVPVPFNSRAPPTFSSSSESKSKIIIEKRDETTGNTTHTTVNLRPTETATPTVPPLVITRTTQNQTTIHTVQESKDVQQKSPAQDVKTMAIESEKTREMAQVRSSVHPSIDSTPIHIPIKKKAESASGPGRPPEKRKGRPPLHFPAQQTSPGKEKPVDKTSHPGFNLNLPVLKVDKSVSVQIGIEKGVPLTLELENSVAAVSGLVVHRLKSVNGGNVMWEAVLPSKGAAVAGSRHVACVVCDDCTLSIFSLSGSRLYPPISLNSPATRLTCSSYFVMVITSRGSVCVWDLQRYHCLIRNESLLPIMQDTASTDLSILCTGLTGRGAPLISLSSGKSYIFSSEMSAWVLVSQSNNILHQCSDYYSSLPTQELANGTLLPLASLQGHLRRPSRIAQGMFRTSPSMQRACTLSHLDAQLAASLSLHSSKEYHFWLLTLVRYLAQEGLETRLREMCDQLLGPVIQTTKSSTWDPYVLGIYKHDLLKEILPVIGSNLRLQRLFAEYKEQLDMVSS